MVARLCALALYENSWVQIDDYDDPDDDDDPDDNCDLKNGQAADDVWVVLEAMCSRREGTVWEPRLGDDEY